MLANSHSNYHVYKNKLSFNTVVLTDLLATD